MMKKLHVFFTKPRKIVSLISYYLFNWIWIWGISWVDLGGGCVLTLSLLPSPSRAAAPPQSSSKIVFSTSALSMAQRQKPLDLISRKVQILRHLLFWNKHVPLWYRTPKPIPGRRQWLQIKMTETMHPRRTI